MNFHTYHSKDSLCNFLFFYAERSLSLIHISYTAFSAKESYINENSDLICAFTSALQKGMEYVNSHDSTEIAKVIAPQFPDTDESVIAAIVERYNAQDTWKTDIIFTEDAYTLMLDILEEAGQLSDRTAYEDMITTESVSYKHIDVYKRQPM